MVILEATYSKKLGLPGYSSHQYSVTVRAEVADLSQVDHESKKIHGLLQQAVDREIQQTGFLPHDEPRPVNGNGVHRREVHNGNGNGHHDVWKCSTKQRDLILKMVKEQRLDKGQVEQLSQELFGLGVKALNKLQASSLIEELIAQQETNGHKVAGGRR
jgi:hypothetical protein